MLFLLAVTQLYVQPIPIMNYPEEVKKCVKPTIDPI